jgi:predicted ester cyclase
VRKFSLTAATNKDGERLILQVAQAFNSGELGKLDKLFGPSLSEFKEMMVGFKSAFPDATFVIEDMFSKGDKVVDRYTISGTHIHPFRGVLPTQKRVSISGISIVRVSKGRISERSGVIDELTLMRQLGVLS